MSYGSDFILTLFTNEPGLAKAADDAGVNRIGLDLEKIGKERRQDARKAWVSDHQVEQLAAIRDALKSAELFARTNPLHEGLASEIDVLIEGGVQVLMLPMFRTLQEAAAFIDLVNGRAKVSLLVETGAAAMRLHEIVKLDGIDEIHVGLNDMHLDLSLANHFEILTSGFVDMLAEIVLAAGIPFGFAGVGRAKDEHLPVPPDLIYSHYPRVRATRALIARSFYMPDYRKLDLVAEVIAAREMLDYWHDADDTTHAASLADLRAVVREWAS